MVRALCFCSLAMGAYIFGLAHMSAEAVFCGVGAVVLLGDSKT